MFNKKFDAAAAVKLARDSYDDYTTEEVLDKIKEAASNSNTTLVFDKLLKASTIQELEVRGFSVTPIDDVSAKNRIYYMIKWMDEERMSKWVDGCMVQTETEPMLVLLKILRTNNFQLSLCRKGVTYESNRDSIEEVYEYNLAIIDRLERELKLGKYDEDYTPILH